MPDPSEPTPTSDTPPARDDAPSTPSTSGIFAQLGPAGVLGVLWALLPAIGGFYLLARIGDASDWLQARGDAGPYIYIGLFAVAAGFGLLPTYAQAFVGGWIFSQTIGTVGAVGAALGGFTGAAFIGYVVARLISRDRVEHVIAEHPRSAAAREALIGRGFWRTLGIVTLLRIPPNSPFALTNLVMASSGVRLLPYGLGTIVGMTPRTALVVIFAATAASEGAKDLQDVIKQGRGLKVMLIGFVVLVVVLFIVGRIANRAIERVVPRESAAE